MSPSEVADAVGRASAPRSVAPPVYAPPPSKVRDDTVRPPLPGQVVDTVFFVLATVAAGWLAWRLLDRKSVV